MGTPISPRRLSASDTPRALSGRGLDARGVEGRGLDARGVLWLPHWAYGLGESPQGETADEPRDGRGRGQPPPQMPALLYRALPTLLKPLLRYARMGFHDFSMKMHDEHIFTITCLE